MPAVIGIIGYTQGVRLVARPATNRASLQPAADRGELPRDRSDPLRGPDAVSGRDILLEDPEKLGHNVVAAQRYQEAAIHVYRAPWAPRRCRGARSRCWRASIHRGRSPRTPSRRPSSPRRRDARSATPASSPEVVLNVLRHLLKEGAGGPAAAGTGGDLRSEAAESERLQHLLRDAHLLGAVATGLRRERDPDGVADAFLQQNAESRRCSR